jgi:transposase InsO family protein
MRYRFIEVEKAMYPVTLLCRVMQVSRSGFYAWQQRPVSPRAEETRQLDAEIKKLFEASKRRSGSPKITHALIDQGWRVGKNRVARRMRVLGLRSIVPRRFKVTTNSQHRFAVAPNRLQRDFTAQRPNQVWVSDLTYLRLGRGWLYLVVVIDLYSRRVVGWALSSAPDHRVVLLALQRAVTQRRPPRGLIIHSDRGVQTGFNRSSQRWSFGLTLVGYRALLQV